MYLDGLRGMAALYVVVHHAYMEVVSERVPVHLPVLLQRCTDWLGFGQVAVDVFIVLSGYSLMLPVAQSGGNLRGGVLKYLMRRARRILPPYYIALLLSILLIALVPGMNRVQGFRWDAALPALTPGIIGSHLLLIQNLNGRWLHAIDPPMWSVATEWQIYFLFPWLLLPLWRRFGSLSAVGAAFGIGLVPHFVFHQLDFACPWYLGLFALGMAAASVTVLPAALSQSFLKWSGWLCLAAALAFIGAATLVPDWLWSNLIVMDTIVGLITGMLLCFCTGHCAGEEKKRPLVLRLLETPAAVLLGSFSYSLYLVHFPLLSLLHLWLRADHLSVVRTLFVLLTAGTGASLLISYGFHLLFERRFMPGSPKNTHQAEEAAAVSPAP